jgi:hypothetical protein
MLALLPVLASVVPWTNVPVAKLAPKGYEHQQVLQIDQDFHPNDKYEIALDAWISSKQPGAIAAVRMWWLDTGTKNERSPFGKGVRRHIDITYDQVDDDDWAVRIKQGRKAYVFDIELDPRGKIEAFADVATSSGTVEHCKVRRSRLVARKILGIPAGLKRLDVTCRDGNGNQHEGYVVQGNGK